MGFYSNEILYGNMSKKKEQAIFIYRILLIYRKREEEKNYLYTFKLIDVIIVKRKRIGKSSFFD